MWCGMVAENSSDTLIDTIDQTGVAILPGVFSADRVREIVSDLSETLGGQSEDDGSIRSSHCMIYAARNLLAVWPRAFHLACQSGVRDAVRSILGPGCGLVRGLYFDKPPGRSWSLPWHKDMTIAVRDNTIPSEHFCKPTRKAGVMHIEAPGWLLEQMLTARIHLDDVTSENGPLLVIPGSHQTGKEAMDVPASDWRIRSIVVAAGDVLLMRPLVAHSSGNSMPGTRRHRRIVHLEFASAIPLPDGYHWHHYLPLDEHGK